MKISPPPLSSVAHSAPPGRASASGEPTPAISAGSALTLSDAARAPQNSTAREAPVDEPRIAALRQAVQEGHYQVDSRQVADRILQWTL